MMQKRFEENTVLAIFVFGVPLHALISFSQDIVPSRLTFIATAAFLIYGLHSMFYVFEKDYLQIVRKQLQWEISYKNDTGSDLPSRIMPSKGLLFDRIPMIRCQSYCSGIR